MRILVLSLLLGILQISTPAAAADPEPSGHDRQLAQAHVGQSIGPRQRNYPDIAGSTWSSEGHPDWNVVRTTLPLNPTEWQIYATGAQGKAHCGRPGVDGSVVRDGGTPFDSTWTGRRGFYIQQYGRSHPAYSVASVADASHLTLTETCAAAGVTTFQFITTTNDGTVDIAGPTVTWKSGQPFNVFASNGQWWIDGVASNCRVLSETSASCNTTGSRTNVPYHSDSNIDDEVAVLRLQKVFGADEENLTCSARAVGSYDCRPTHSGNGFLWPWYLGDGNYPHDHSRAIQIALYPDGSLMLGGSDSRASLVIPAISGQFPMNFVEVAGGASGTSRSFPVLGAKKCSACGEPDVPLGLQGYGRGSIVALSPLQLPGYVVAALPPCSPATRGTFAHATDLAAVAYAAPPVGGGTRDAPVYCDGSEWTIH